MLFVWRKKTSKNSYKLLPDDKNYIKISRHCLFCKKLMVIHRLYSFLVLRTHTFDIKQLFITHELIFLHFMFIKTSSLVLCQSVVIHNKIEKGLRKLLPGYNNKNDDNTINVKCCAKMFN